MATQVDFVMLVAIFGRFTSSLPSIILPIDAPNLKLYQTEKYMRTEELNRFLFEKNINVLEMTDPKMA